MRGPVGLVGRVKETSGCDMMRNVEENSAPLKLILVAGLTDFSKNFAKRPQLQQKSQIFPAIPGATN